MISKFLNTRSLGSTTGSVEIVGSYWAAVRLDSELTHDLINMHIYIYICLAFVICFFACFLFIYCGYVVYIVV